MRSDLTKHRWIAAECQRSTVTRSALPHSLSRL
jgi:hypothetical protein